MTAKILEWYVSAPPFVVASAAFTTVLRSWVNRSISNTQRPDITILPDRSCKQNGPFVLAFAGGNA
jgi:hypothetical protein